MASSMEVAKRVEGDNVLMLRNVILNDPDGIFPVGITDKVILWSCIYEFSGLSKVVGEGIDPLAMVISRIVDNKS